MNVKWLPYDIPGTVRKQDESFECRHTELFANRDISQRAVSDDLALGVSLPSDVLLLHRVVEHGAQAEYDCLGNFSVAL